MGKTVIGIDLGTTNSCVAYLDDGEPKIILSSEGGRTTPSVVSFTKTGERLVGQIAKRQAITNPENTIYSIKRFMGRRFTDLEVQHGIQLVPYRVKAGAESSSVLVALSDGKQLSPPEISAMILAKLKTDAEAFLGEEVTQAVITVPAYFDDNQRQATKDAGKIAGLEVLRIINEPTAAALAYGLDKKGAGIVAVYDLGGGTFDISLLTLNAGNFVVKATNGDTRLGGDDFDEQIITYLLTEFEQQTGINLRADKLALQRLKEAAEKAKIELSTALSSEINLPFITANQDGPQHMVFTLTRAKLEQLVQELVERTLPPLRQCLQDAGLTSAEVNEVLLVGGQTRMPLVAETVARFFSREPNRNVNPDEVVAAGAAVQAGLLGGELVGMTLTDVMPLTLGLETVGGIRTALIARNTVLPAHRSMLFTTAEDYQTQVEIHVLQGEREMAADNKSLGRFILTGIPGALRGQPKIDVAFDVDSNGLLAVTAKDQASAKEQRITVTASSGLSPQEISRLIEDAKNQQQEDTKKRDLAEAVNRAEALTYKSEKVLVDNGTLIAPETVLTIEEKLEKVHTAVAISDLEWINVACGELELCLLKVGKELYRK